MEIFAYTFWTTVIFSILAWSTKSTIKGLWLFIAISHGLLLAIFATAWTYGFLGGGFFATLIAGCMAVAIIWFFFIMFSPRSGYDRDGRGWDDGGGE